MRIAPIILLLSVPLWLQGQHLTHREWMERSLRDMRLAPAYGGRPKNAGQLASDSAFVAQMLSANPDRHACAEHLLDLGFDHLKKGDMVSAMYRFNHAYLMEPGNPRIRRGYGAFFMALDRTNEAAAEYKKGLALDSANVPLMMDMASLCLMEYYEHKDRNAADADQLLATATVMLKRAVALEPGNAHAHFKLSVCHLRKNGCEEAWEHYRQAISLDPDSVEENYEATLGKGCPPKP